MMWQKYFGDQLTFHGMDINPYCKVTRQQGLILAIAGPLTQPICASCVKPGRTLDPQLLVDSARMGEACGAVRMQELFEDPPTVTILIADQGIPRLLARVPQSDAPAGPSVRHHTGRR